MSLLKPLIPAVLMFVAGIFQPWGGKGDLIFFIFSVLCFGIGFFYMKRNVNEHTNMNQASAVQKLVRHQRHDLLNHVQVIMGYQMMNKPDRIANYLQKIIDHTNHERKITDFDYPPLAAMLLTIHYDYPEWDWQLILDDDFSFRNIEQEKQLYQLLLKFFPWFTKQAKQEKNWMQIQLRFSQHKEQIVVRISCIAEEGERTEQILHTHEIAAKLDHLASCSWSTTEQQLIIKMTA